MTDPGLHADVSVASGALSGTRVLDRSSRLAGAYCAKLLADLGADVVRVEPTAGDPARVDGLDGLHNAYLRASQRSVTTRLDEWERGADVVLRDEPGPTRALVAVTISALGFGGPDDGLNRAGLTEPLLQARSGALIGHGHMTQTPLTVAGNIGEYVAGAFAALSAATVLRRARRTGIAETIDVSVLEAMQLTMLTMPTLFANFPGGAKTAFRFVMIPGNEPCADGNFVGITTNTLAQWRALAEAMGRADLLADESLNTMIGRFMKADLVTGALRDWTMAHTAAEIEAACEAARVPVAVVGNGKVLLEADHLRGREVWVEQPGLGVVRPRAPFRFSAIADRPITAAPGIGEHDTDTPWAPMDRGVGDPVLQLPLSGVRVLDFTAFWAGPSATAWLVAMGAEVIKVESVQRPDGMRMAGAMAPGHGPQLELSPVFHAANLAKRGITLDLTREEGRALARRLMRECDVVCENFTPRVMDDWGLGYDAVRAERPDVVMLRLPAFGLSGPWRDRPGFAQTMEQLTGMAWATGYENGPPIIAGGVVDPMVGAHAALAVVAAIEHRDRTGEGQLVEVPMVEVALATTADQVVRYQHTGDLGGRRGAHGVYRCEGNEAWVAVDDRVDPLGADARAQWCATRTPQDAAAELRAQGVPALAAVPGYATLDDPQLQARRFFEPLEHHWAGLQQFPTWPTRCSGGPDRWWAAPAPLLGEHTRAVLGSLLGLSDADLDALEADRIIGTEPD